MFRVLFARVDRRIADLMLARARRRWPLLGLVPRTCVRQVILPAATVARQDVVRVVAVAALVAGTLLVLIPALGRSGRIDRLDSPSGRFCVSREAWVPRPIAGGRMPEIGRMQPGDLAGAVLAGIREASDRLVRAATGRERAVFRAQLGTAAGAASSTAAAGR